MSAKPLAERSKKQTRSVALPRALVAYLESLMLAGGDHDGSLFTVLPWEKRFIRGAFGQPGDAALTVARGNGKSALVAGLACAVADPDGPLHGNRREVTVAASAFTQSRVIFEDVLSMLRAKTGLGRGEWRIQDSANNAQLEHRASGARVRCVASDPKRMHGLRPALVLCDEPAQWESAKADRALAALRTGLGKVPGSRLIALGTRPAASGHWFSRMLREAAYAQSHAAPMPAKPFQRRTWRRANPSMDRLPSLLERIEAEAGEARRDPSLLASFRALRLNMGTSDVSETVLIDVELWASIEGEAALEGAPVWGVDLGTSAAQSAVAAFWPRTGALRCLAAFPEDPSLDERGLLDGVGDLYRLCAARGELLTLGHRSVDVAELLRAALGAFGRPSRVASDRWREAELKDALDAAGVPMADFEARGQGFKDGGEDVRAFRRACADGDVAPAPSLLLRSAMAEARTVSDAAGNMKLAKQSEGGRRQRARDDAAAAAILAVSAGARRPQQPARRWRSGGLA